MRIEASKRSRVRFLTHTGQSFGACDRQELAGTFRPRTTLGNCQNSLQWVAKAATATSGSGRFLPLLTPTTTVAHVDIERQVTGRYRSYMLS